MDGSGESRSSSSTQRQPWTLEMMLENRENWNLAGDVGVLEYLQKFGNELLDETENTLQLLDSFETELNTSCVQVSNITNKFLLLADTQFVENRVQEDEELPVPDSASAVPSPSTKTKQEEEVEAQERLKEAINNGFNVLRTKFETVEVTNSDSEDDDSGPTGVVYKPINPFNNRPLPHLIGSVEFMKDPTVGLEEPPSDDEEDESIGESSSESKPLSEENDDSELDSDRLNQLPPLNESQNDNLSDILYKQPISSTFADHLAKRLEDMDNERKFKPQPEKPTRSLFSTTPPPLDESYDDDFGSNEDLIFGNRNSHRPFDDDLFTPKSKSSLWDDDRGSDLPGAQSTSIAPSEINERRKNAMSDFEKELSKTLQKRKVDDDDIYDDILSPSPPPLDKQIGGSYDDLSYSDDNFMKRNDPPTSLFNNDEYERAPSKSFGSNEAKRLLPGNSKQETFHDRSYIHGKDSSDSEAIAKSTSNFRRRIYGGDDTDEDSVMNNENIDTEDVNNSIFKTMTQQDKSKSSSRSSSVKMTESFQDDNVSIKSNRSAGLFDDVVTNTSKKIAIKKNMDDLFSDLNYQNQDASDEEDDLFSSYLKSDKTKKEPLTVSNTEGSLITSVSKTNKAVDDLFGEVDHEDIFSKLNVSKSDPKTTTSGSTSFSTDKTVNKTLSNTTKKLTTSLFDDDDWTDVFNAGSVPSKVLKNKLADKSKEKEVPSVSKTVTQSDKKKTIGSLFDDTDESDLFGSGNVKTDLFGSDLFGASSSNASKNKAAQKTVLSKDSYDKNPGLFSDDSIHADLPISEDIKSKPHSSNDGDNLVISSENKHSQKIEKSETQSQGVFRPDKTAVPDNKLYVKTATVKQISLFSDEEENIETNSSIFTNIVKSNDSTDKKDKRDSANSVVVDDSPLFNESINKTKSFTESSTTKVIDSNVLHVEKYVESKSNSGISSDLSESSEVVSGETSSLPENAVKNSDSEKKPSSENSKEPPHFVNNSVSSRIDHDELNRKVINSTAVENENFDKKLPTVSAPMVETKKPVIPIKPKSNKPEPPKSLNIRPPISSPDRFGSTSVESKVASIKKSLDIPDGGAFSSEKSSVSSDKPSVSPRIPGKLNLEKTLLIDPKTLLPGARPSFKKSSSPSPLESKSSFAPESPKSPDPISKIVLQTEKPEESKDLTSSETSSLLNSEPVLHSLAKDRVKIQVKRRPQTRKARREAVRQSMIDNVDGDETDNSSSIATTHSGKERSAASSLFDPPSNILSPSTDEEDLFGVPPLDLPADYTKVSSSPGDIFGTPNPTIISPDLNASGNKLRSDSSVTNIVSDDNKKDSKVEISDDLFKPENVSVNKNATPENINDETTDDLFSSNKLPTDNSRDLFSNVKTFENNAEDLFAGIKKSKTQVEDNTDNIFKSSEMAKDHTEVTADSSTGKTKPLFSNSDSLNNGPDDLFTEPTDQNHKSSSKGVFEENQDAEFPVSKTTSVNLQNVNDTKSMNDIQTKLIASTQEVHKNVDKLNIFADLDDSDLFSSASTASSNEIRTENKGELVKSDPSTNIICSVFNTGVVNICDKLSPPNDDELFPPSDWTITGSTDTEENKTITSVPEKIKTNSLFDENLYDDPLFAKETTIAAKKVVPHVKDTSVRTEFISKGKDVTSLKIKTVDRLFSNEGEDDDDSALFGEVKTAKTKESLSVSSNIKHIEEKRTKTSTSKMKSSLFDGDDEDDDPNDIFASSANRFVKSAMNKSSNIFDSGDVAAQSVSKKSVLGVTVKKYGGTSSSKTSDTKTKDDFIDPLSAFADND